MDTGVDMHSLTFPPAAEPVQKRRKTAFAEGTVTQLHLGAIVFGQVRKRKTADMTPGRSMMKNSRRLGNPVS